MKIGIVGCGTMGHVYAERMASMQGVRVEAVCHPDRSKAALLAARTDAQVFESYERMLALAELDIVCITLPTYLHPPYISLALEAGKHVICEKPLALRLQDCASIAALSGKCGRQVMVAHVVRFFPAYARLRAQVMAGAVGEVRQVFARRVSLMPPQGSWFRDQKKSGGVVFDLMIHDLDYILWLLGGNVVDVRAAWKECGGVKLATAVLQYADGRYAELEAGWGAPAFRAELAVAGSRGRLDIREGAEKDEVAAIPAREGVTIPCQPGVQDPYYKQLEHFIAAIRLGQPPLVTIEQAGAAVGIAERINQLLHEEVEGL